MLKPNIYRKKSRESTSTIYLHLINQEHLYTAAQFYKAKDFTCFTYLRTNEPVSKAISKGQDRNKNFSMIEENTIDEILLLILKLLYNVEFTFKHLMNAILLP